ncbi:MAG TPA: hypothetical protein VFW47_00755 [Phenylobacterium sp.]|nr:hypothetical protein [Phenylobacterium sp.]
MAKSQKRSGRETRKPKTAKVAPTPDQLAQNLANLKRAQVKK